MLAACSTDLWRYRGDSVTALATRLGVCASVYSTLKAGRPLPPVALTGCQKNTATDSIFQAASLTKPVVAFGVLQLVQAGTLDLSAPVSRYLPGGYTHFSSVLRRASGDPSNSVSAEFLARVPVATLLNHTSGLPNWSGSGLSLSFAPGERWQYSGEGYVLLQAVVEAVASLQFTRFIEERVFAPLGMRDSSLIWQDRLAPRAATGQSAGGATRQAVFEYPVAAASLYTTASDYARFMAAFAVDEQLLALTLSRPALVDRNLRLEWGYGWGVEQMGTEAVLWQWGNNPGFRSFAMFSASSKDGFVLLTNSDNGMPMASALAFQTLPGDHNAFKFSMVG
jgi:CubicO group peptidase (beta-lactamase class C family)